MLVALLASALCVAGWWGPEARPAVAVAGTGATSAYTAVSPSRLLDTRTGVGTPAGHPGVGASVRLQVAGRAGVPVDARAVVLNLTVTESRQAGYVQALPFGSGALGQSSNVNVTGPGQTSSNLVTVPLGTGGAVTLHDVAGGHLVADVLGFYASAGPQSAGRFVAVTPARSLDTRDGFGMPYGAGGFGAVRDAPGPRATVTLPLVGRAGVPASGVSAVVLTVTATSSSAAGFVQVVPGDGSIPLGSTSSVNVTGPGQTVANMVVVPVRGEGTATLFTSSGTHLVADVIGYVTDDSAPVSAAGLFVPLTPARVGDTRQGAGVQLGESTIVLPGRAGIPAGGVGAVLLNATVTGTAGSGYLQVFPSGRGRAGASSNLNYTGAGQTVAASTVAGLGVQDRVSVHTSTSTHVVLDISGYFIGDAAGASGLALRGWGPNDVGELGDALPMVNTTPALISTGDWAAVSAGHGYTLAVRADGSLWSWGTNTMGQLGDGTTTGRPQPRRVGTRNDWTQVSAGRTHATGLTADGALWMWGAYAAAAQGPLRPGASMSTQLPVRIRPDMVWSDVSAGDEFTVAVARDGSMWTWGIGPLAGDKWQRFEPGRARVSASDIWRYGEPRWVDVEAGVDHVAAISADGGLWLWGENVWGQLGDGGTSGPSGRTYPNRVVPDGHWSSVAAGASFTLAVRSDGSLWAWGNGGHLGDGTQMGSTVPIQIGERTDWMSVEAGHSTSYGIDAARRLWAWGISNQGGQLGDGSTEPRLSPTQVGIGTTWRAVSAGRDHALGLGHDLLQTPG